MKLIRCPLRAICQRCAIQFQQFQQSQYLLVSLCTLTFSFLGSLSGDDVICLASIREWDLAVLALHQDKVRTGIVFPVVCLEGWPDVHVLLLFPMYYTELSTVIIPSLSTVAPPMMAGAGHGSRECIFPPWYIMDLELTLVLHGVW